MLKQSSFHSSVPYLPTTSRRTGLHKLRPGRGEIYISADVKGAAALPAFVWCGRELWPVFLVSSLLTMPKNAVKNVVIILLCTYGRRMGHLNF